MTKLDLVALLHQQLGITKILAAKFVDHLLDSVKTSLEHGEVVKIARFGKFVVREKEARLARNPQTGEGMMIPARRVVAFHPSPALKAKLNKDLREK